MSIESFCDDKLIYEGRRAYICSDVDESYKVIFVVTEKHSYSLALIFVVHSLVLPEYHLILLPWMPITRNGICRVRVSIKNSRLEYQGLAKVRLYIPDLGRTGRSMVDDS